MKTEDYGFTSSIYGSDSRKLRTIIVVHILLLVLTLIVSLNLSRASSNLNPMPEFYLSISTPKKHGKHSQQEYTHESKTA